MDIAQMIQAFGFPVCVAICLGLFTKDFIEKAMADSNAREQRLIEANTKLSDSLEKVADITERATNQLNKLDTKIDTLQNKVDKLDNELKK